MAKIPPFNPTPTKQAWKPTRKEKIALRVCGAYGCTLTRQHNGPHFIPVSTRRIEYHELRGVKPIVCPKCGFQGSGGHTILNADGTRTRCVPIGKGAFTWR